MLSNALLRVLATLLAVVCSIPAQAGILTHIQSTNNWHGTWTTSNDGRPAVPFGGTLASNLVQQPFKNSCRVIPMAGEQVSWCYYDADFSGMDSPFVNEFKTRFKQDTPLFESLMVDLEVRADGRYHGTITFIQGNTEIYTDQSGTYQSSLNTNYQFWYGGEGLAPDSFVDLEFTKRIWSEGQFTKYYLATQWDVLQLLDSGDSNLLEFEQWEGYFDASTGTIPEPAAPLLFGAGLLALAGQRAAKRRAGVIGREA